jgi:hypothetical protein
MNDEERQSINKICEQYFEIFHLEGDKLTCTHAAMHEIKLNDNQTPIYKRLYRLPHAHQEEIANQIKQMNLNGIIEPSRSPWNSPLLLVAKKIDTTGKQKYRIVVDFRSLNKVTLNEFHPLSNITEILDQLDKCQLFRSGFTNKS